MEQFNSGTDGVLKFPIEKETAIFFEIFNRVKDPVTLHAAFYLLSTQGTDKYDPFNNELSAWLLASCASGYGCKNNFALTGGFATLCLNKQIDCFNKSPEELVIELTSQESYEEVLQRAWEISHRIKNGRQEQLVLELLSKLSPENAKVVASIQANSN